MTFTEADRKKLEALKAKERQAKQEARNEAKRNDTLCKKLFGLTVKQVKDSLAGTAETSTPVKDWWQEYYDLKCKVERLMTAMGKGMDDFDQYVEYRERMAREKSQKSDTIL